METTIKHDFEHDTMQFTVETFKEEWEKDSQTCTHFRLIEHTHCDGDEVVIEGWMKGDGCTELEMNQTHVCGPHSLLSYVAAFQIALKEVYKSIPSHEPGTDWDYETKSSEVAK